MGLDFNKLDEADGKINSEAAKAPKTSRRGKTEKYKQKENESQQVRHPMSFSIDNEVKEKINDYCKKNMINKSVFVESLIVNFFDSLEK